MYSEVGEVLHTPDGRRRVWPLSLFSLPLGSRAVLEAEKLSMLRLSLPSPYGLHTGAVQEGDRPSTLRVNITLPDDL